MRGQRATNAVDDTRARTGRARCVPPLIATNAISLTGKKLFSRTQVRRRFSSMLPRTVLAQLINDEPAATSFTSHTSNPLTLACSNVLLCSLFLEPTSDRPIWSWPLACAGGVTVGRVITTTRNDDEERMSGGSVNDSRSWTTQERRIAVERKLARVFRGM